MHTITFETNELLQMRLLLRDEIKRIKDTRQAVSREFTNNDTRAINDTLDRQHRLCTDLALKLESRLDALRREAG